MAPRRSIATLMAWLLLVSLAVIGIPNASEAPAAAQPGIVHLPDTSSIDVKTGELATVGTLARVAEPQPDQPRGLAAPTDSPATDALLPVEDGRICIDAVAAGDGAALLADLEALDLTDGAVVGRSVGGCLPVDAIDEAAQLPTLQSARPAISVANVGATTSQGDTAMSADVARITHGIDGSGVTVGVLSNSYDCAGGAAADVASGDLPSGITVLDDTDCPATDEGRAMMQIIADVAPGAGQAFHTGTVSQAGFAQGVVDLESAGADVIVDDILFLAEPMFQDGIVAQAVDQVKGAGAAYFSAAGNFARRSYEQDFRSGSGQSAPAGGELHDFDPGPGIDVSQAVTLPTGTTLFSFQWNDLYASAGPGGSATDYDIYLCTSATVSAANCATSGTLNNLGGDPVEVVPVTVTGGPGTVWVALARFGSAPGRFLKYVAVGPSGFSIDEHDTQSGTIYGHANAAGAEAVGAAAYASTPPFGTSPPVREPFSSAGGTAIHFDTSGNPVGPTVRQKPELVAPDGVNNTFFPQASPPDPDPEGDGFPNFGGTSAAAPHAAAAAALLLECDPSLTPDALYGVLESNAIDMEGAGFDDATGYGLVDVSAAAGEACDASPGGGGDQTFAVVGDYGTGWTAEGDVASLIDSYAPEFIITTGDNFYNNNGGDYDSNVGAFYGDYIGGAKNRFFPSPGNTDYGDPAGGIDDYLDFFDLPGPGTTSTNTTGSELYFDVIEGSVHFFFIDTTAIINGWSSAAAQKQWLQTQLAASTTPWQAVVLHHPPFTSRVSTPYWDEQWPFAAWGADVLFAGHDHSYERFAVDGIPHFISGLGGRPPHDPAFSYPDPHSVPGTQYNSYNGAMIVGACDIGLAFEFHAWNDDLNTDVPFDPYSVGVPCDGGLAPPVSPSSLSAAETGPTSIEVIWTDNASNEAGFDVEVSTTGINGPWTLAGSVGPDVETYHHTGRSPATEYCYRARATNTDGTSPPSSVGCATTASAPPPLSSYVVDFGAQPVVSYGAGNDVSSVVSVEDAGGSLRVTGNGWKKIYLPTEVTSDTVLEFDFSSGSEGEIHGLGFDADDGVSPELTFQLFGTQLYGLQDYATYSGGVTRYRIPVGQFYTGTFDYLFFAADHDVASPTAESWFSNVEVSADAAVPLSSYVVDFGAQPVVSYGAGNDVSSVVSVEDAGASLRVTGNGWKKIYLPTEVTSDTVLEFDFSSGSEGEIHGLGFDADDGVSPELTFQLFGTQNWGLQDYATYSGGVTRYRIPVGQFYTGTFDYLFFAADHDVASPTAESWFSNVEVSADAAVPLSSYVVDFGAQPVVSYGAGNDVSSVVSVEDAGGSLRVTGNGWKKIYLPTEVTSDTVLEFDFSSGSEGEIHGLGFDADDGVSPELTFQLFGTQLYGLQDYATYSGGVTRYRIPVGQFYTGTFDYLFFAADHDVASPTAESWFSNVEVSADAAVPLSSYVVDFGAQPVVSYGAGNDVSSVVSVEDAGASLRVTGNGWKKIYLPTEVTSDTVLEFDFSSGSEGEIHGIGFDADDGVSPEQTFQLFGTQLYGLQDYATYSGGVTRYRIPVGQFYTGTFDYLFFAADHDVASPTAESWFSNVEVSADAPSDTTPPVITLLGANPQTITELDPYVEAGASAFDVVDGDLTASIVIDASEVDTSAVGTYQVTYNVSDAAGNVATEVIRTVEVNPLGGLGEVITIPAGVHYGFTTSPADNETYSCEPGAILDGQGSTQYAFNGSADHVSIIGCEIRNYNNPAQQGAINGTNGAHDWLVRNNNIHDNWGIAIFISGDRPIVKDNHLHHQHQLGIALNNSTDGLVEGNEIDHNNWLVEFDWGWEAGGSKFWSTTNLILRNNHVHDNHGPGLWTDNNNTGTLVEDNLIEDNCANGVMHEISFDAVIRNNTVNRNGSCHAVWFWGPGILISASSDVEVYGNTLSDNFNGVTVVDQCRTDNGTNYESLRNSAHHNVIDNSGISGAISDCGATVELQWNDNTLTGNSEYRP